MTGNIVLCGFMGCGKSTVGKRLAKEMGRQFLDMDEYIEEREGRTVAEIFSEHGEEGFREREARAAREISLRGDLIVASGGGTVLFPQNVEAIHQGGGTILLLYVPLAVLQERLKNDTKRPLLQVPDRQRAVADLYRKRMPLYRAAADYTVRAMASPAKLARSIAEVSVNF